MDEQRHSIYGPREIYDELYFRRRGAPISGSVLGHFCKVTGYEIKAREPRCSDKRFLDAQLHGELEKSRKGESGIQIHTWMAHSCEVRE